MKFALREIDSRILKANLS